MAQPSKKALIVHCALPLFLEHGIKGTSIDMVVRQTTVSKATVYNHFPDKVALFRSVLEFWLSTQSRPTLMEVHESFLRIKIEQHWLQPQALKLYSIVIAESHRIGDAKRYFLESYDQPWRQWLAQGCQQAQVPYDVWSDRVDARLLQKLLSDENL